LGSFVRGDIVAVPFPFSDLSKAKRRPALVLVDLKNSGYILLQVTSQHVFDDYALSIDEKDLSGGSLNKKSNLRPNRIFTADEKIILYKICSLKEEKMQEVIAKTVEIIEG
jgi:mRNA interferase MazF